MHKPGMLVKIPEYTLKTCMCLYSTKRHTPLFVWYDAFPGVLREIQWLYIADVSYRHIQSTYRFAPLHYFLMALYDTTGL